MFALYRDGDGGMAVTEWKVKGDIAVGEREIAGVHDLQEPPHQWSGRRGENHDLLQRGTVSR